MKNQIQTLQQQIATYSNLEDFVGYQLLLKALIAEQQSYIAYLEGLLEVNGTKAAA